MIIITGLADGHHVGGQIRPVILQVLGCSDFSMLDTPLISLLYAEAAVLLVLLVPLGTGRSSPTVSLVALAALQQQLGAAGRVLHIRRRQPPVGDEQFPRHRPVLLCARAPRRRIVARVGLIRRRDHRAAATEHARCHRSCHRLMPTTVLLVEPRGSHSVFSLLEPFSFPGGESSRAAENYVAEPPCSG